MTYPNSFRPDQEQILTEFIPAIEALLPGDTLIIKHEDMKALDYRRYLLYAWLSPRHQNKKELFRISTLTAHSFQVLKRSGAASSVCSSANEDEAFVMEHLLECISEEAALSIIRAQCPDPAKQISILAEWRRKQ